MSKTREVSEETLRELADNVRALQTANAELHEKHRQLLSLCLRHLKPQRVQYPWDRKELLKQRQELINALEMYVDNQSEKRPTEPNPMENPMLQLISSMAKDKATPSRNVGEAV